MTALATDWAEENQDALATALERVRDRLERCADWPRGGLAGHGRVEPAAPEEPENPPALQTLADLFALSPFSQELLLLCAGVELDASFAPLCARAQGDPQRPYPTISLALSCLPGAAWHDLTPAAPLRRWRLVEIGPGPILTSSPLRIDERILHYLLGVGHRDERLAGLIEPVAAPRTEVPSHRALAERIAATWSAAAGDAEPPAFQLCGPDVASKRAVAAGAAARLGIELESLAAETLPTAPRELDELLRLLERETALAGGALLIECDEVNPGNPGDTQREGAIVRAVEGLRCPVLLSGPQRRRLRQRPLVSFDVGKPTPAEQRELWRHSLGAAGARLDPRLSRTVDSLVWQFDLSQPALAAASAAALGECEAAAGAPAAAARPAAGAPAAASLSAALWHACRGQARPHLEDLAQRIVPAAGWDGLVLPERERQVLREIAVHVRHRATVHEAWGFAATGGRGLGTSALFCGASGTGKTLAAEVLAGELDLDLYRVDLAVMVSKYIGETEKNLRRVFDAAEEGGAILLFDEADALFGRRSEVRDSHDRYANIEVSYLLQRMETYRGLAILTTNLKDALDTAFLRRLRFVVQFPFPDVAQRAELWRRVFPPATPTRGLDPEKLARLNVAGGNIRNIALSAAFHAASDDGPVEMRHLLAAARGEYGKLGRPLTEPETRDWIAER